METTMTTETQTNAMLDSVKQAFAPVTEAFSKLQTMEVPEATRDFVKRAAGTAQEKAANFHAGSEKLTGVIETAVTHSVGEAARISRNIQTAVYEDFASFFAGIDKLASARSFNEAVQIQTDLMRSHGEVLAARARSSTEYLGKLVTDGARTAQENLSKASSYAKSA